ncbi:hypothetical protein IAD21_02226 [Abditibacteriota bacterium]|nr:hypothetical protein IAD21_02226 [Abditibacteriota bacterium]
MPNEPIEPNSPEPSERDAPPTLPHATQKSGDDNPPPLYISGFGVMGQAVPDVATGSTPVTRPDD